MMLSLHYRYRVGRVMPRLAPAAYKEIEPADLGGENGEVFPASSTMPMSHNSKTTIEYAGFVSRAVASLVDSVIVLVLACIGFGAAAGMFAMSSNPIVVLFGAMGAYAFALVLAFAYFPMFEGSAHQATPGKMLMGMKVAREDGGQITPATAWLRMLGKMISNMTCYVGYLIALFSERKQTLHDILAKTIVIKK